MVGVGWAVSGGEREAQTLYFYFGFFAQPMLVGRHASRRTESHTPVAMHALPEFAAAVVTPELQRSEGGNLRAD